MKIFTLLLGCILLSSFLYAQQVMEGGILLGFANYQGDLTYSTVDLKETKPAAGVFLRYHLTDRFKIKGNINLGTISGDDANAPDPTRAARGWKFESKLMEAALQVEFHPFKRNRQGTTGLFKRGISPYVSTGIGFANADTRLVTEQRDGTDFPEAGDTDNFITIPFAAGIRFDITECWSLGLEGGWRTVMSDYLDDISQNGNPNYNDWYAFSGLTISYFFGDFQTLYLEGR